MVQWFFLDRIYAKTGRPSVADQFDLVIETLTDITKSPLTLAQAAMTWAQVALNATIIHQVPVFGSCNRSVHTHIKV
jgi:hypothetical protein